MLGENSGAWTTIRRIVCSPSWGGVLFLAAILVAALTLNPTTSPAADK